MDDLKCRKKALVGLILCRANRGRVATRSTDQAMTTSNRRRAASLRARPHWQRRCDVPVAALDRVTRWTHGQRIRTGDEGLGEATDGAHLLEHAAYLPAMEGKKLERDANYA